MTKNDEIRDIISKYETRLRQEAKTKEAESAERRGFLNHFKSVKAGEILPVFREQEEERQSSAVTFSVEDDDHAASLHIKIHRDLDGSDSLTHTIRFQEDYENGKCVQISGVARSRERGDSRPAEIGPESRELHHIKQGLVKAMVRDTLAALTRD